MKKLVIENGVEKYSKMTNAEVKALEAEKSAVENDDILSRIEKLEKSVEELLKK